MYVKYFVCNQWSISGRGLKNSDVRAWIKLLLFGLLSCETMKTTVDDSRTEEKWMTNRFCANIAKQSLIFNSIRSEHLSLHRSTYTCILAFSTYEWFMDLDLYVIGVVEIAYILLVCMITSIVTTRYVHLKLKKSRNGRSIFQFC